MIEAPKKTVKTIKALKALVRKYLKEKRVIKWNGPEEFSVWKKGKIEVTWELYSPPPKPWTGPPTMMSGATTIISPFSLSSGILSYPFVGVIRSGAG